MYDLVINSLIKIFNDQAYTNLTISNTLKNAAFSENEKKLYTKLVYGVVDKKYYLDYLMQPLTKGKRIKPYVKNALRIGVYGLEYLNLAPHYLINELVATVKKTNFQAAGFVNAILRKYQMMPKRSLDNLPENTYLSIKYSINQELVDLLNAQYPKMLPSLFGDEENIYNIYRINHLKAKTSDIISFLDNEKILYEIEDGLILKTTSNLINTTLFQEGKIVAQDKASIKVGLIANPKKHDLILDACSAPGSKAMHLASIIENEGTIIACDIYPHKIQLINDNAQKLGVTCLKTFVLDARVATFDELFDLILVDAPCSGLGVMRHKPDLKYQMTKDKIASIKTDQKAILNNVVKYLKKHGILVYSTCTINKEENEGMIKTFLETHPNFEKLYEESIFPSNTQDGFYICKLQCN